jgi:hypothetical protein
MRARMTVGAAVLVAVLTAPPAVATADRVELIGPDGNFHCGTGDVTEGRPGGFGSVVLQQHGGDVVAVVHLRRLDPRSTYVVRLVQVSEDQLDCQVDGIEVRTNAAGHAVVRLSERVSPTAIGFNVAVNTGTMFGSPHWVGARTVPRT